MQSSNTEKFAVTTQIKRCRRIVGVSPLTNRFVKRSTNKRARREKKQAIQNGTSYTPRHQDYIS